MKQKFIDYYMDVAERTAKLSSAIRRQVGAVIVKDNRILSYGYNGMPTGWDNVCENKEYMSGDAGGWYKSKRTYITSAVSDDGNTLADHTNYCFYMNWNGFSISPFTVAHTNAALSVSTVNGSVIGNFGSSEVIFAYSIGTNSSSAPGNVEFILSSSIVGEANSNGSITEKEYGYVM